MPPKQGQVLRQFYILLLLLLINISGLFSQGKRVEITVYSQNQPLKSAIIRITGYPKTLETDSNGMASADDFKLKAVEINCQAETHKTFKNTFQTTGSDTLRIRIDMVLIMETFRDFVVTGTQKTVRRSESPVPVEVYQNAYFKKNPTPNLFEALQNVNGVRPQLNCNICNTGDIHINGLEGPYTMVLIDGMPIVSSLSTVYGLSGIPNSLVERLEIVKGPASSLYGSEAVGGLINVITKRPNNAPIFSADIFATSWGEYNADFAYASKKGKYAKVLNGLNYYNFGNKIDKNSDGFTDVTLQHRISLFQKWSFNRKSLKSMGLAARYFYEDRWGGETRWSSEFRGGDSIYAESIFTKRFELMGNYELPFSEKLNFTFSYNRHLQNSYYGNVPFMAEQRIFFSQLLWDKKKGIHDLLSGLTFRHTFYDDNTPATSSINSGTVSNKPQSVLLPGAFIQDEVKLNRKHRLLGGFRYDYNSVHGHILTPRVAWKYNYNVYTTMRLNAGTGYRVVNIFTEDHAALTGARNVVIKNELLPERSMNVNFNFLSRVLLKKNRVLGIDFSAFYTRFGNRIIADYETDVNSIIYDNLKGYAVSRGLSANFDLNAGKNLKLIAGCTYMEVFSMNNRIKTAQILTEKFSATWSASYLFGKQKFSLDYTGNLYSPMRLPVLGPLDPRKTNSPWWSIQNLQLVYNGQKRFKLYGGVKNILNWTPNKGNPFIIARSNDPFDKKVQFDSNGKVIATSENPYALSFDPNYVYGPNQGRRFFLGFSYTIQ